MVLNEYQTEGSEQRAIPNMFTAETYQAAIDDLRKLLRLIGRADFRAFGYVPQLRRYRSEMRSADITAA